VTERQDWAKQPRQAAAAWYRAPIEHWDRLTAIDLLGCMNGEVWEGTLPDLHTLYMRYAGAQPKNRKRVYLALQRLQQQGLLIEHEGYVLLLYAVATFRRHIALRDAVLAQSLSSPNDSTVENHSTPIPKRGAKRAPSGGNGAAKADKTPSGMRPTAVPPASCSSPSHVSGRDCSTPTSQSREEQRREEPHTPIDPVISDRVRASDYADVHCLDAHRFADSVQTRFKKLHEQTFGVAPGMGGKAVAGFPEQLRSTATLQGVEPLALLETAFARWAKLPDRGVGNSTAYAAFVARFERCVPERRVRPEQTPEEKRLEDYI
jgi:hypothetical protein